MHDRIGHNHRTALHAERSAIAEALSIEKTRLDLARAANLRAMADLQRARWEGDAAAPVDRAEAAREALRAAHARRARLRDEMVLLDDSDDIAA